MDALRDRPILADLHRYGVRNDLTICDFPYGEYNDTSFVSCRNLNLGSIPEGEKGISIRHTGHYKSIFHIFRIVASRCNRAVCSIILCCQRSA